MTNNPYGRGERNAGFEQAGLCEDLPGITGDDRI
jgi:hypothetical protein